MRRREFITLLGSTTVAWPLSARAQQPALPVIGFLRDGSAEFSAPYVAGFRKGLNETGYVDGQNVTVEYHWLEGHALFVAGDAFLGSRITGVDKYRNTNGIRYQVVQESQPLVRYFIDEKVDARHVAARSGEACNKTLPDRIFTDPEDDRDLRRCRFGRLRGRGARRGDHGHLPADQVGQ
jgi:hypothetical protein